MPVPHTTAISVGVEGAVGAITLSRPAKLNALNRAALEELTAVATWFDDEQPEVKVVIVSGEGRSFSAGFDLADPTWAGLGPPESSAPVGRAMAEAVGSMRAVTIASIRGHCIGGGVVLAAACDLRVASDDASFRIPEVDLGIPLFWTGIPRLVRELGPALTKELVMSGRPFDGREAKELRFVNHLVADTALEEATAELAGELASKPAFVLRTTKEQVEEAAPAVPATDGGADADRAGFAQALRDPECVAVARAYTARRRG